MEERVDQFSPNGKFKLTFFDFEEPRMMMSICRFSLVNLQDKKEVIFNPLWAIGIGQGGFSWSKNGKFLSLPTIAFPGGGSETESFFVYNIEKKQFAAINFTNCWVLDGVCHDDHIEIEFRDNQIPERAEHNKYPTRNFTKPANLFFNFSELQWADIRSVERFNEINKHIIIHRFEPVDNRWRQFKGQFPQNTEILIWNLKKFAEYGDTLSKNWFAEISTKTTDINYWVNASSYIGFKTRE